MEISIHTSPEGSDLEVRDISDDEIKFQSTLPLREVTSFRDIVFPLCVISIHTSPEGSDPRTGIRAQIQHLFQSTLPLREVTSNSAVLARSYIFQSTLPLREVTVFFEVTTPNR